MNAKSRLVVLAALALLAVALAPASSGGFRSEDFLDFDWYSRTPLRATITGTHLGSSLVTFWRPLADACTWMLVRVVGPDPVAIHLILALLTAAAAWSLLAALRDLFEAPPAVAIGGALLAVVHPFGPAVTTYLDGGLALLLVAIATFQALAALGRWRNGGGRPLSSAAALLFWTLAAMLAHDAAIVLPVIFVVVALLLPPGARRAPVALGGALLGLIPLLLLARFLLLGKAFDGYATLEDAEWPGKLAAFPGRVLSCGARLFVPAFPGSLHASATGLVGALLLGAVTAAAIALAIAARRGERSAPLRQGAAILALVVGLLGLAPDFFVLAAKDLQGNPLRPDEVVFAYRTYPAALAASLAVAWLAGLAASGRKRPVAVAIVLLVPVAALFLWLRAPIAAAHDEALRWGRELPAAIAKIDRGEAGAPDSCLLILEVPVANHRAAPNGERLTITRAFQFGLSCSQRPPFLALERLVYPLFRVDDGMHVYFRPEAIDAFAASPWLRPLTCRLGAVADVVPAEKPTMRASPVRLFAGVDAADVALAPDLSNAPIVEFWPYEYPDERGARRTIDVCELAATGLPAGRTTLLVLNRMAFFVVPLAKSELASDGRERLYFIQDVPQSPRWFREVATRFPDDVHFVALQTIVEATAAPGGAATIVSNVLPIRLRERKSAP